MDVVRIFVADVGSLTDECGKVFGSHTASRESLMADRGVFVLAIHHVVRGPVPRSHQTNRTSAAPSIVRQRTGITRFLWFGFTTHCGN